MAVSCQRKDDMSAKTADSTELTFKAYTEFDQSTKTTLQQDNSIMWNPYESINLFYGNSCTAEFVSTNSEPSKETEFKGSLSDFQYNSTDSFWAVYPFSEDNICDGQSVTVTLPSTQTAKAGSFDDKLFISVAKSTGLNLYFYNLCGGVRFTLRGEGIRSVRIEGANGETLAGKVKVSMNSKGLPYVSSVEDAARVIQVNAPDGGTFEPGRPYYIVMLPCTASKGFNLRFSADQRTATTSISKSLSVKRSVFGILSTPDEDLLFKESVPSGNIAFADENIKAQLVSLFDTDADGELSYAEADAVTSLSGVFGSDKSFTSFDEFQYFTSVRSIENGLFQNWTKLVSIQLPESINKIGNNAFNGCSSLKNVKLGNLLKTIGTSSFQGCVALESLDLGESVQTIGYAAFKNCTSLAHLVIPDSVTAIDTYSSNNGAFQGCTSLLTLEIGNSLKTVSAYTFANCTHLASVSIGEKVESIGDHAFYGCSKLSDIPNGPSLKTIGNYAFCECIALGSISIPDSVESIGTYAFQNCSELDCVSLGKSLLTLGAYAFNNCRYLKTVTTGDALTTISGSAFRNCERLTTVTLGKGIKSIGDYAFSGCTYLSGIDFPESLGSIGSSAFYACKDISMIEIPANVTSIGSTAFAGCEMLSSVIVHPTIPPSAGGSMFSNTSDDLTIRVPPESLDRYLSASGWKTYKDIITSFNTSW